MERLSERRYMGHATPKRMASLGSLYQQPGTCFNRRRTEQAQQVSRRRDAVRWPSHATSAGRSIPAGPDRQTEEQPMMDGADGLPDGEKQAGCRVGEVAPVTSACDALARR